MTTAPDRLPFGKYAGRHIAKVLQFDPAYLQWVVTQPWFRRTKYERLRMAIFALLMTAPKDPGWQHRAQDIAMRNAERKELRDAKVRARNREKALAYAALKQLGVTLDDVPKGQRGSVSLKVLKQGFPGAMPKAAKVKRAKRRWYRQRTARQGQRVSL